MEQTIIDAIKSRFPVYEPSNQSSDKQYGIYIDDVRVNIPHGSHTWGKPHHAKSSLTHLANKFAWANTSIRTKLEPGYYVATMSGYTPIGYTRIADTASEALCIVRDILMEVVEIREIILPLDRLFIQYNGLTPKLQREFREKIL